MTQRALLSAYDKTGIVELARALHEAGVELVSSSGTAKMISEAGLPVTDVADITGVPPILDHRVVTLHPKIHGGILADPTKPSHQTDMEAFDITPFTIIVNNLYPFASDPSIDLIDIGGPAMVRAAAKNHEFTTILVDPSDYRVVIEELRTLGETSPEVRKYLARKAIALTAGYDAAILSWMNEGNPLPDSLRLAFERGQTCAYGENGWQKPAGLYSAGTDDPLALSKYIQEGGTAPSYNNLVDLERALQTAAHIAAGFERNFGQVPYMAVGLKHGNACGAGVHHFSPEAALRAMILGDSRALHGGVVLTNFEITSWMADMLLHLNMPEGQRRLLDVVAAPAFGPEVVETLSRKKGKCRLLANPALGNLGEYSLDTAPRYRYVRGGMLLQPNYTFVLDFSDPQFKWVFQPFGMQQQRDAVLAWAICATSNSNTITLVHDGMLIGNGVGQQDRVSCAELAIKRALDAGHGVEVEFDGVAALKLPLHTVACSDSFFPFDDGPRTLISAGARHIIATSGSVNDNAVTDAFLQCGFLGWMPDSEARSFYGH